MQFDSNKLASINLSRITLRESGVNPTPSKFAFEGWMETQLVYCSPLS